MDFAFARLDHQPFIHHLRDVQHLMRHDISGITKTGRGRDRHLELFRRTFAKTGFPRPKHRARHRDTCRLAGEVDDHRQGFALTRREQARANIFGIIARISASPGRASTDTISIIRNRFRLRKVNTPL